MRPFSRADRVGELIQKELSAILHKEIKDPRLDMITITGVKLSADLKHARIYFSTAMGEKSRQDAMHGFKSALGYIKRTLASKVRLRYMPEIKFYYDDSFDYGSRIDKLLKSINSHDGADHTPFEE